MHIKEFEPDTKTIIVRSPDTGVLVLLITVDIGHKLSFQSYLIPELETNEDSST